MRNSKKANLTIEPLAIIILGALVLVLLFIIAVNIYNATRAASDKASCQDSLRLSGVKLNGLVDRYNNPVKINCKTEYLRYKTRDDEEIKKIVANKMVDCWDTYLKGESEIFNTKDNNYCVVCSRLEFDKKTEIPHYSAFLNSEKIPIKGQTYLEYLKGVKIENYEKVVYENTNLGDYDNLSTKEPLAVMFVMGKQAFPGGSIEESKWISAPAGAALGMSTATLAVAGTALAGAAICSTGVGCLFVIAGATIIGEGVGLALGSDRTADWNSTIMLWPYNNLNELDCTYLEAKSAPLQIKEMTTGRT